MDPTAYAAQQGYQPYDPNATYYPPQQNVGVPGQPAYPQQVRPSGSGQVKVTHCGDYSLGRIPMFIHSNFLSPIHKLKDKHRLRCRIITRIPLSPSRDSRRCAMTTFPGSPYVD